MAKATSKFPKRIKDMIERNYGKISASELTDKINKSKAAIALGVKYTMPQIRTAYGNLSRSQV